MSRGGLVNIADILAQHQRAGAGMTAGSPDMCRCNDLVYPPMPDIDNEDISIRRDRAFAHHQARMLMEAREAPCLACPAGCVSCTNDESNCECYEHQNDHPDAVPIEGDS